MLRLSEAHEICEDHSFIHLVLGFIILLNLLGTSPLFNCERNSYKNKENMPLCLCVSEAYEFCGEPFI
jgi:hypothetical protein